MNNYTKSGAFLWLFLTLSLWTLYKKICRECKTQLLFERRRIKLYHQLFREQPLEQQLSGSPSKTHQSSSSSSWVPTAAPLHQAYTPPALSVHWTPRRMPCPLQAPPGTCATTSCPSRSLQGDERAPAARAAQRFPNPRCEKLLRRLRRRLLAGNTKAGAYPSAEPPS